MAKVLVTGGAGFIGSHLVEALVKEGHEVTVFDSLENGKEKNLESIKDKIKIIKGDICKLEELEEAFKDQEYVFHLAAVVSVPYSIKHPLETHNVNTTGTLNVLIAAKHQDVNRVIYSSSAAVYGDTEELPKKENGEVAPESPYATSKLTGEEYAKLFNTLYGLEVVSLRYFNVYGPRQDPSSPYSGVISKFVGMLKKGEAPVIFGDGMQTRDFVYVGDVVQANIKAMEAKVAGEVLNVATGVQVSIQELLVHIEEIMQTGIQPKHEEKRAGDILHSVADVTKSKEMLGYKPDTTIHEGLDKTINSL